MQETFETSDIFRSAYLMCQGCELDEIAVEVNGRRTAVFKISGDDVSQLDLDYRNGQGDVYLMDIPLMRETPLCTQYEDQGNPNLWGDTIIWQDYRGGRMDLYQTPYLP